MQPTSDKIWFVYMGNHHEGPFTFDEVKGKVGSGSVTPSHFVWKQGMPDWQMITQIGELNTLFAEPAQEVPTAAFEQQPVVEHTSTSVQLDQQSAAAQTAQAPQELYTMGVAQSPYLDSPKPKRGKKWIKWVLLLLIVGAGAGAYYTGHLTPLLNHPALNSPVFQNTATTLKSLVQIPASKISQYVPWLARWISPIPSLPDVTEKDYETLKAAASASAKDGAKAATATSQEDPLNPSLYLSTNLPDGSNFDLIIEGISETLLNQTSFTQQLQATTKNHIAKTTPLKQADGKPIPRGEYKIVINHLSSQGAQTLSSQTLFLGGPKDASYTQRLTAYHQKLKEKSLTEIAELKQMTMTLITQFNESITQYNKTVQGKMNNAKLKNWNTFHNKWIQLNTQLDTQFQRWTPDVLTAEYFYSELYLLLKAAATALNEMHTLQNLALNDKTQREVVLQKLPQTSESTKTTLMELKDKVQKTELLEPSPTGMPRKL